MSIFKADPQLTDEDVKRIARVIAREEIKARIETLENLIEPAPEPVIPGLIRFAVDAFEAGSLAAAMVGAFAIKFVTTAVNK